MKKMFAFIGICLLAPVMLSAQSVSPEGAPWFSDDPHFYWNDHGKTLSVGFTFGYQGVSSPSEETPVMYTVSLFKGLVTSSGDTVYTDWELVGRDTAISNSTLGPNSKLGPGGETNFVTLQKVFQKDSLYKISLTLTNDSGDCQYDKVLRALDGAPLSIETNNLKEVEIMVYPTLFSNSLTISSEEDISLTVIDMSGKQIVSQKVLVGNTQIPTTEIPNGNYVAYLTSSSGTKVVKISK